MAEIKSVEVSGVELERRIRAVLEYSIQESETMLNKALAEAIAQEWFKTNKKKLMANLTPAAMGAEVIKAVVAKAVFALATERL